ncbi:prolyl oligopeptidase family serine peptidase [Methanoplanus sp. FWC-SCC4]|uniref:Prolyl oligopeptidase family serine peptidase n=1 Tax=Methanochimaera problematica TaxID=2609417 RepID=A0AA97I3F3_9EURY|nr:alpha/beta hydrolase [Methanoplanus sp. FWC-SCC4]WOF16648.1 prolyl oligopeptidase family serine peptidase [Methanoplanus sp. FWC-SCC4]
MRKNQIIAAIACIFIASFILVSGCTQVQDGKENAYQVSEDCILSFSDISYTFDEHNTIKESNSTLTHLTMKDGKTDVYSIMAKPVSAPVAAVVFAPGAGVSADAHKDRAISYADQGILYLVVDVRGNGGKTNGYPFSLEKDFNKFLEGEWAQYYLVVRDLLAAGGYLKSVYPDIPVYVMGSSNGGRFAAVAAGMDDSVFSGYFGVSTSGFIYEEGTYGPEADRFLKSINPDTYIKSISPDPVFIFHAPEDKIIPFDEGMALFNMANEPKDFIAFNGTHGVNAEVDDYVKGYLLKP